MSNLFNDEEILPELIGMVLFDRQWLRFTGDSVSQDDFKPIGKGESTYWVLAGLGLEFHRKNRIPIGSLIVQEVNRWCKESGAGEDRQKRIKDLLVKIKKAYDPARSDVLRDQVLNYKKERTRSRSLRTLVELDNLGSLTDELWMEHMKAAMSANGNHHPVDYVGQLESRINRRSAAKSKRLPVLMIDPLDILVRSIGRGHLGLWLAPYKQGKSLALIWTATSYLFQGLNVLYFTLEDPLEDVEDRFDACIAEMLIEDLSLQHPKLKARFQRFKSKLRSHLRIVDGTEGGVSVSQIESIWERERALGFDSDAVIVDYDDEIKPPAKRAERREEFGDIYRAFRMFLAKRQVLGWLAAQATREAEGKKVIRGKMAAEDISKIRKSTLAIGIGQGDWGPDSKFLYVAAHKFDQSHVGCHIWSASDKGMFYDADKTLEYQEREANGEVFGKGGSEL